jgi:hypothetical protein
MGSTQSSIPVFADITLIHTYVNLKLSDGSMVPSEAFGYTITTEAGNVINVLVQEFNYAVKLGDITTEQANSYTSKKGFPILTNGTKFGFFRVFGHQGEYTMKDCFTFFPENSVKSFCFAFNGNNNGFTISKTHGNLTIDIAFLESFLGMTKTFDATKLGEFPEPKPGKAPVAAPATKVSSASSWVSVAKTNTPIKTSVVPVATLEEIQDEEAKLNAQLVALSLKKEVAKKALAEELQRLEEEEKANKARELVIKERQAKLKLALQSN